MRSPSRSASASLFSTTLDALCDTPRRRKVALNALALACRAAPGDDTRGLVAELLEAMPPYEGGGSMIRSVTFEETIYAEVPTRFEAGTPHIAGGIGLGAAIDYLNQLDIEKAAEYEDDLMEYATQALYDVPGLRLIGTAAKKVSVLSFVMEGIHPHDVGTILDQQGVAVRAGHHCAQPVMRRFGLSATTRASTAIYNTREDIDALVQGLHTVNEVFR